MKLNAQHYRFVASILKGNTATQAARDAGFSEKNAHRYGSVLMKKPAISREIERQLNAAGMDPQRILAEMWDLYRAAIAADSYGPAKDILLLLGKHHGMWQDRRKVEHAHTHAFEHLLDQVPVKDVTPAMQLIPMEEAESGTESQDLDTESAGESAG